MSLRTGPRIPESEDVVKSDVLTPQHKGDCIVKKNRAEDFSQTAAQRQK